MDILVLLQVFGLGWVCCHFFMVYKLRKALKKVAEDNNMTLDELAEGLSGIKTIKVPNFYTETSGNSILLYNKDTGKFMGQANTIEELAENIYKFEKVKFALVNHDSKQVWFVEGKIRNDLKELQ